MQVSNNAIPSTGYITAVLGPTNTGKTHYAIEEMVTYDSGVIGFPLRLLARENYERLVKMKGRQAVALITGEEKIIPRQARYYSCTVEAMPVSEPFDFLAVDEIQLCADPDRGHIFTDRLLRARGTQHTMFLGAETIAPLMKALVPGVDFRQRPRLSELSYRGFKKLTRLPKRSAVVAFSIDDVYAMAEMIRSQRGGTAVVLGALSPRTRNRQVEMYQNGEVDFLVATDAIGMGLNMDIHHVALASVQKFDGQRLRYLDRAEIAQVAGRAGRYKRDGTFGVTGRVRELDDEMVEAIENHRFDSLKALYWRNSILDFENPKSLLHSLSVPSGTVILPRGRPSDDYMTLEYLVKNEDVMVRATDEASVRLLWEVCQIPDFRKTLQETHYGLISGIYQLIADRGGIPEDMVSRQLAHLDKLEGDVDTLMTRIAHIRTWTYITHKPEWLDRAGSWQEEARAVEDRLSDALHDALIKRFVDRRSAVLIQAMEDGAELLAGVKKNGEVIVEGQAVGTLHGFRFTADEDVKGADFKAVMAAARNALRPEIKRRLEIMLNADYKQFTLDEKGTVLFQEKPGSPLPGQPVARIRKGQALLQPDIEVLDSALLDGKDKQAIAEKLQNWLKQHINTVLEALLPLQDESNIEGAARGIAFQIREALGIVHRADLENLIEALDENGRAALRARRIRMGPVLVFLPALNKPAAIRLRALLWTLWNDRPLPAEVPPDGITSITVDPKSVDKVYYRSIGYPVYGPRAIRVDMLDRLVGEIYDSASEGKFEAQHKMAEWLGCSIPDLYAVIEAMGHKKIHDPAEEQEKEQETAENAKMADAETEPVKEAAASGQAEGDTAEKTEDTDATATTAEKTETAAESAPAAQERPQLATFVLRRGKAYGRKRPERAEKSRHPSGGKPQGKDAKKNFRKPHKGKKPGKPHGKHEAPRVHSARADKVDDSPFAVLQALKSKGDKQ